jgi:O-antigen/teichoic acid export membrane protein
MSGSDSSAPFPARELARGTGLILAGGIAYQVLEYLYRFTLARGLGVDGFGTFNQARSVLLLLVPLAALGLGPGMKRFVALLRGAGRADEIPALLRGGTRVLGGSVLVGAGTLAMLARPLAVFFHNDALAAPLLVLAAGVPAFVGLMYTTRVGEAFRSFRPAVIARQILNPLLRLLTGVALVLAGASLPVLMGGFVASLYGAFAVAVILVLRILPDAGKQTVVPDGRAPEINSSLRSLVRYSIPVAFGGIIFNVADRIDILMLGYYLNETSVGIYSAASPLARTLLILGSSVLPVMGTLSAECAGRGDLAGIARLRRRASRWTLLYTAPFAVGLAMFPDPVVTLFFGEQYAGGAVALRILVPGYLAFVILGPLTVLVNAMGRSGWSFWNVVVRTVLNVALNAVLIPRYGIPGAAVATGIALVASTTVAWFMLGALVPLGNPFSGWLRPAGVLAGAAGAAWGTSAVALAAGASDLQAALGGGVFLLLLFAAGIRFIPGCMEEGDLDLPRMFGARMKRGDGKRHRLNA